MHEKFSVLKNVGTPTGMLVTIASEKIIGRDGKSDANQQDGGPSNTTPASSLARSNTLTTNQRLRGLISSKRPSFMMSAEKALPLPSKTPPPPPPPASDKPRSPVLPQHLQPNSIYGSSPLAEQFGSVSQISLPDTSGTGPRNGEESTEPARNPN
jgi:vacuolar protein sorting-associated protein 54